MRDNISCNINFKIKSKPSKPLTEMALSEVDGNLQITKDGCLVFDEDYICLAEFAAKLSNWLENNYPNKPFIYESMDYDESFIIKVEVLDSVILLASPWFADDIGPSVNILREDFIRAARLFLDRFNTELPGISSIYSVVAR